MYTMKRLLTLIISIVTILALTSTLILAEEATTTKDPTVETPAEEEAPTEDAPVDDVTPAEDVVPEESVPVTATVVVSVDQEIIYTVDASGMIIREEILTAEGVLVLEGEDLGALPLAQAVQGIQANLEEGQTLSVYVTSSDETLLNQLVDELTTLTGAPVDALLEVDEPVDEPDLEADSKYGTPENEVIAERFELANEYHVTPGHMNLLQKLYAASGETIDYADWVDVPVKDIMSAIRDFEREEPEETPEADETVEIPEPTPAPAPVPSNNGNGHGNGGNNGNSGNNGKGNGKKK